MDELFAAPAPLLSITKVNQQARLLLERQFSNIGLFGEISNHKLIKGHHYFTLKDGRSELPAVLFRADAQRINFALQNGAEVEGWGRLTLYEERGRYQVILKRLSLRGVGELQQRFERLKAQLQKEGLFADERKRRLPLIPGRVAVVTSASGSVIRDIIHVAKRRLQNPDILVIPSPVQGATAAAKLEFAIRRASALSGSLGLTSLIVARGGGSLEDLWAFNDESVARAIFQSTIPVVSAIGHETDYTIADFVADIRAPTPSAAAELVFPLREELERTLHDFDRRAQRGFQRSLREAREVLENRKLRLGDPQWLLEEQEQRLANQVEALSRLGHFFVNEKKKRVDASLRVIELHHPRLHLSRIGNEIESQNGRILRALRARLQAARAEIGPRADELTKVFRAQVHSQSRELQRLDERVRALSPLSILERGYAIATNQKGEALRTVDDVEIGETIKIRLSRGSLGVETKNKYTNEENENA